MTSASLRNEFVSRCVDILENRAADNPRVLLAFSGIPGSGKTTLALKLAHDLKAQYIQHDKIRRMIVEAGYDLNNFVVSDISHDVIDMIMNNDKNKFVIIDASIDRAWPKFFSHEQEWNAYLVVIRLNVPIEVLRTRLVNRDGAGTALIERFDEFVEQFNNCKRQVKADFELDQDYDYAFLLAGVKNLISIV